MKTKALLKKEEQAIFSLRALYRSYGYLPFKMSKFEEYDLYGKNKDFLVSDRVITFTDTNGKLMALKPDVTLSIIKNGEDQAGCKQKVCYNENVYRVSKNTKQFKEIMQTGLECFGDIDLYDVFEVVDLAAQSLSQIAENFVLDLSHQGILTALLADCTDDEGLHRQLTHCIAEKNTHDLEQIGAQSGIVPEALQQLCRCAGIYGPLNQAVEELTAVCQSDSAKAALEELKTVASMLSGRAYADRIRFDLSVVGDMNYYNGFVFKGFLSGICEGVLAGGQYDKLMRRMGRTSGAIGFALYLDLLEELQERTVGNDVDVLLLYDRDTKVEQVARAVRQLIDVGKSVSVQRAVPPRLRYGELRDLSGKEGTKC